MGGGWDGVGQSKGAQLWVVWRFIVLLISGEWHEICMLGEDLFYLQRYTYKLVTIKTAIHLETSKWLI